MSIKYIKENLKKFDHDNLISFLFDIVTCGGLDSIEDFDETKTYTENEKVYFQDVAGLHHIYKCKVENSTPGQIVRGEWVDLLQSFRKPIANYDNIIATADIQEEVILSAINNQTEFTLTTPGIEDGIFDVIVYHPELGRIAKTDFTLSGNKIILNAGFEVAKAGGKLIIDLYRMI